MIPRLGVLYKDHLVSECKEEGKKEVLTKEERSAGLISIATRW